MSKKIIYFLMLAFSLSLFTACSDDDDPENLILDKNEITLDIGATETVKITKGNGDYKLSSNEGLIATAELSGNEIKVTAIKDGSTTFEISDKEGKKVSLKVVVRDYAASVEGVYAGELTIKLGEGITQSKDIQLERTDKNVVTVSLKEFSLDELLVGDIIVDNIPVDKTEGSFEIVETVKELIMPALGNIKVNVTISGTVKDNKLDLNINVDIPEMSPVEVTFAGDKKVEQ